MRWLLDLADGKVPLIRQFKRSNLKKTGRILYKIDEAKGIWHYRQSTPLSLRRRRLNVDMSLSSLPRIDVFLPEFGVRSGWNDASINRLRSAGEETLSSLLTQDGEQEDNKGQQLIISARRAETEIEMEFMVTSEGGNLEDKLAYLSEQPEIHDEEEISFRLLRHYASSVRHRKYHDIDIITVQVAPSS